MVDGLSIAGLAIASVDQLLKLGERTAQLVSDVKAFQEDSELLSSKIKHENYHTTHLRRLLFDPSPVYNGQTLFENFDEEGQDYIRVFFGRIVHTLREAHDLLDKRYRGQYSPAGEVPNDCTSRSASSSSPSLLSSFWGALPPLSRPTTPNPPTKQRPKSPMLLLRWSLHDKKRSEDILKEWMELNSRIREDIKMLCLTSSVGLNARHLQRLETDENSKELGFNLDAALQLSASQASPERADLSLKGVGWVGAITDSITIEGRFEVFRYEEKYFLQEVREYENGNNLAQDLDPRTKERVNGLASLLSQPKEDMFCIPHCIGWQLIPSKSRIAFVFETPEGVSAKPISLLHLLNSKDVKVSLSQRASLASALSKSISQLHLVKWVHESFRSENILFFPGQSSHTTRNLSVNYSKPNILGFAYSRPDLDFSAGLTDVCIERDVYRHPDRQGCPAKTFTKIHDIYALGVVLLEIGLWQPALTLENNSFKNAREPKVIMGQLLKNVERRLGDKMGDRYAKVVKMCLTGDFGLHGDVREDTKVQQAFRLEVVDVLDRLASCL